MSYGSTDKSDSHGGVKGYVRQPVQCCARIRLGLHVTRQESIGDVAHISREVEPRPDCAVVAQHSEA